MSDKTDRRTFLNKACLGTVGMGAACSLDPRMAMAAMQDGQGPTNQPTSSAESAIPQGRIGNVTMSRMLSGGNLIGGWAHARDLIYVSRLFQAYNTESKVFDTLALMEQSGIDTIQIDPACCDVVGKYRRERGSKIKTMVCMSPNTNEGAMRDQIKRLVDWGSTLLYTHGEGADRQTMAGRLDVLAKAIELIKAEGLPAGIGSHSLQTPIACEKEGVGAEYYVKTYHLDRYWSATPKENREEWCWYKGFSQDRAGYHDNIWCLDPEETVEFFETVEKPWVAFKVLAAGAIQPQTGISSAFRNGADFVIVGMFDFQVAQNVAIAREAVERAGNRKRPWRAPPAA